LPTSLSSRPMAAGSTQQAARSKRLRFTACCLLPAAYCLVVTRHGLDREDHLVVGHLFGRAEKARVAPVQEDRPVPFGVASQRADQLPSFRVVERTEVHTTFSFP